ncbi:gtp-binding protein rhoa [Anaeramoeba ignava]|uniref:Gtp-binding protein rhoa n=1 Tax=Anaeramoeba ignava TaxID=1746090 RepID=A0A9Q0LL93_ANAIG|nr:gtp-binding protein rhoa [Anaeramoeba ignava]|eukprot:Anaeramoba_ignava/a479973_64.p1 GENE.a479973_64~~a479973_64.p1  ORF type:complete len:194 (+),score=54.22 a479973_64:104-685(+)
MTKRFKLVCVGDGATGKTCLLSVFSKGEFPELYVPTVFESQEKDINVDGQEYLLHIFDTAGQEDMDRIRPLSYPDTNIVLVCFSIDNHESFDNVKLKWIKEIDHYCPNINIVLAGLKTDLRTDQETLDSLKAINKEPIKSQEGQSLSIQIKAIKYVECSSKTNSNVTQVFEEVVKAALTKSIRGTKSKKCLIL